MRASRSASQALQLKQPQQYRQVSLCGAILCVVCWGILLMLHRDTAITPFLSRISGLKQKKEALEKLEAETASRSSCLVALTPMPTAEAMGFFPQELQSIRQGLVLYAASQKLLQDLKSSSNGQSLLWNTCLNAKKKMLSAVSESSAFEAAYTARCDMSSGDHPNALLEGMPVLNQAPAETS